MHIDSALQGIPEEERCPGWKTGNCPELSGACAVCQLEFRAQSAEGLDDVLESHYEISTSCRPQDSSAAAESN